MRHRSNLVWCGILGLAAMLGLAACGGPAGPSAHGVTLQGSVEGGDAAAASGASSGGAKTIVVTVLEQPSLTTNVGADGGFSLNGLPEGSFTLDFTRGGHPLGTLTFENVMANQEITIRVAVGADGRSIVLLEERRDGVGRGEFSIEGVIEAVLAINPSGDSRFRLNGATILVRPDTNIHEGKQRRTVNDLTVGRRVHVRGVWLDSSTGAGQLGLASEIELNADGIDDGKGACMISGGKVGKKIELEGTIAAASTVHFFQLLVNGNRAKAPVDVDATTASLKCNGKKTTPAQCEAQVTAGAKVHVSGLLEACDSDSAAVKASQVMVQK